MSLVLTVGDTPTLTGNVNADLTGASIAAHVKRGDGTVFSRAASITDATHGGWSLPLIVGDLTVRGSYYVELEVAFAGGAVQTYSVDGNGTPVQFRVLNQIA